MSPEVFCFADYPCHTVAIDILKAPPEDDNREIATWYGAFSLAAMQKHVVVALPPPRAVLLFSASFIHSTLPHATMLFDWVSRTLHRKSLDLVESLLRLSEVGQYDQVKQLFSFPIKHCPDMLVLALLQISTSWHTLRHELISTLMPIFLGNHPNSAIILHYAWHGQVGVRIFPAVNAHWCLDKSYFNHQKVMLHKKTCVLIKPVFFTL